MGCKCIRFVLQGASGLEEGKFFKGKGYGKTVEMLDCIEKATVYSSDKEANLAAERIREQYGFDIKVLKYEVSYAYVSEVIESKEDGIILDENGLRRELASWLDENKFSVFMLVLKCMYGVVDNDDFYICYKGKGKYLLRWKE